MMPDSSKQQRPKEEEAWFENLPYAQATLKATKAEGPIAVRPEVRPERRSYWQSQQTKT